MLWSESRLLFSFCDLEGTTKFYSQCRRSQFHCKEELEFPSYDKWPRCDSFRPWRPPAPVSWSPDHLLLTLSAVWANQRPASWPGDQWEASSCLVPALHNPRPVPPIHISDAGTLSLRDFKLETVWNCICLVSMIIWKYWVQDKNHVDCLSVWLLQFGLTKGHLNREQL